MTTILFPSNSPAAPLTSDSSTDNAGGSSEGKRILVFDDNVDAAESAAEILRLFGNSVSVVHDGPAAIRAVEAWQPEVVLLDIGLPGIDGYEVARRIRQSAFGKGVMLVALTGWGQDKDRQLASEAGFDADESDVRRSRRTIASASISPNDAFLHSRSTSCSPTTSTSFS